MGILNRVRNIKGFRSIRTKLILSFLIPVIFTVMLGVMSSRTATTIVVNNYTNSTVDAVEAVGNYYSAVLENVEGQINKLANDSIVVEYYSGEYESDELKESKALIEIKDKVQALTNNRIENAVLMGNNRQTITTNSISTLTTDDKAYDKFKSSPECDAVSSATVVAWSGYHEFVDETFNTTKDSYSIAITRAILGSNGNVVGYLIADVDSESILSAMDSLHLPEGSVFAFVSKDGREQGFVHNGETDNHFAGFDYYIKSITEETNHGYMTVTHDGEDQYYIYSRIGSTGNMVCALIPTKQITGEANAINNITVILVIIATASAVITGILVARSIGSSLRSISKGLSRVANGDLTVELKTKRKDEFKDVIDSVNQMTNSICSILSKATDVSSTVFKSSKNLTNTSERLLSLSKEISNSISDIQHGVTEQANDSMNCLKQTDELSKEIDSMADSSNYMEQIAKETMAIASTGKEKVNVLSLNTQDSVDISTKALLDMERLNDELNTINGIVALINGIASQTRLLSLNASIEAARAGESGRGFTVVAQEIGKLATKSSEAVSTVNKHINDIMLITNETFTSVSQSKQITKETAESLEEVVTAFDNVNSSVSNLVDKIASVVSITNEIDKSKNSTLAAIENISAVSEETSAASEVVDATAQHQIEEVEELTKAAKELEINSKELLEEISTFKIR